jgi:hypothetical protein
MPVFRIGAVTTFSVHVRLSPGASLCESMTTRLALNVGAIEVEDWPSFGRKQFILSMRRGCLLHAAECAAESQQPPISHPVTADSPLRADGIDHSAHYVL